MAKRKRNTNKSVITVHEDSAVSEINDRNQTTISDSTSSRTNLLIIEKRDEFQNRIRKLEAKVESELSNLDMRFDTLLCSIPKSILETRVTLNDELIINTFGCLIEKNEDFISRFQCGEKPSSTARKRRSRSATGLHQRTLVRKTRNSNRSSSLEVFKTPANKVNLEVLTTVKKYTVSKTVKKIEDSGISLKRIMKPNEEAISTTGSPLFVHPSASSVSAPVVNIPLPGGVVMNIEPKKPKGQYSIPVLDETTKAQLRILCQQMSNML